MDVPIILQLCEDYQETEGIHWVVLLPERKSKVDFMYLALC